MAFCEPIKGSAVQEGGGVGIVRRTIQFSSITRRQNGGFRQARLTDAAEVLAQVMQRFLQVFGVKGDFFPNVHWRCVMIDAKGQQLHRPQL